MKEILFISDLHLSRDYPDTLKRFEAFASALSEQVCQLYMLGDVFDLWIGDDGTEALGHRMIESQLRRIASAGVTLFFLPGNRDFLVGEDFAKRTGCQLLPDPSIIEIDGQRVYLTHGDALCTDDIEHQQNRSVMLSAKWRQAFLNQSIEARLDTAHSLRRRSDAAKQSKSMAIMDINQAHLEKTMRENKVRIVIHGHTHKPGIHQFDLNGQEAKRFVLGDWHAQNSVLTYRNGEFVLT